jgi:WD40 repeat protein
MSRRSKNHLWDEWYVCSDHHHSSISSIRFITNDKLFLTGSEDGAVKMWTYPHPKLVATFLGNEDNQISSLEVVGDWICAGSIQGRIARWKYPQLSDSVVEIRVHDFIQIGPCIESLTRDQYGTKCLVFAKEQLQPFYVLDDLDTQELLNCHTAIVTSMTLSLKRSNQQTVLLSGDAKGVVNIWFDPFGPRARPLFSIHNHICAISTLFYSTSIIVTAGVDGTVFVLDTIHYQVLGSFNDRYRSETLDERRVVKGISYHKGVLVTLQGETLHTWSKRVARPVNTPKQKQKKVNVQHLRGTGGSNRAEFLTEVHMALADLEDAKQQQSRVKSREELFNGSPKVHGMNEDDLITYAMLLSMENQPAVEAESLTEQERLDLALALSLSELE